MTAEQERWILTIRRALYSGQISAAKVDAQRALDALTDSLFGRLVLPPPDKPSCDCSLCLDGPVGCGR